MMSEVDVKWECKNCYHVSPGYKVIADMKRLDIIIPHEHLQEVNDILHKHKVGGMTFYDIKGRGRSK